jgi:hypothetical protein
MGGLGVAPAPQFLGEKDKMERDRDILVGEVVKSVRQTLKCSLRTYKGRRFVDIRVFSPLTEGGEPRPTAKGVSVPPHLWPEFRKVLARVDKALCEQKWLDSEDLDGDEG